MAFEVVSRPLDAVLDLEGEVPKSAHRDALFGRILRVVVRLGLERNYYLGVALRTQSTAFH